MQAVQPRKRNEHGTVYDPRGSASRYDVRMDISRRTVTKVGKLTHEISRDLMRMARITEKTR